MMMMMVVVIVMMMMKMMMMIKVFFYATFVSLSVYTYYFVWWLLRLYSFALISVSN